MEQAHKMDETTISQSFVPRELRKAAQLYEERNKLYGDNYKYFGKVMIQLFPNGLMVMTDDDWNRLAIFIHIMTKVTRYANLFYSGGHSDSLQDIVVYASMLRELDEGEEAIG